MSRTYHYHGFDIEVAVEADFSWKAGPKGTTSVGFVAVVRISKAGASVAVFSPLAPVIPPPELSPPVKARQSYFERPSSTPRRHWDSTRE
jgi:hypothetical protein